MDAKKKKIIEKSAEITAGTVGFTFKSVIKVVATCLLIMLTTGLLFGCIFAYYVKNTLSTDLSISLEDMSVDLSSTIWYQDAEGQYQELVTLSSEQNRIWVSYDEIPEYMEHAIIAIEDKRFREHKGVDWYRTTAAFAQMFVAMKNDFGGSTLTQQLIKNVTENDDNTVERKLLEIFRALELERNYEKQEIIEWYLNVVYFGQGCWGIYTAADVYFGKEPKDLTLAEAACIAGITNSPTLFDPYINPDNNKERQETILYEMYDQGFISYEEYTAAVAEDIQESLVRGVDEIYEATVYSYYVETVINDVVADLMADKGINERAAKRLLYSGGYQIYCSLDMDIQNQVDAVFADTANLPQSYVTATQQLQSAIVIMDPYTGEIVALSGGVGEKTGSFVLNRATGSQRSPGSSIKPLSVFGPALEYGYITQTTLVNDADGEKIKLSGTTWYTRNANLSYDGIITIRTALAKSTNTVAAQIVDKLTPAVCYDYMTKKLGFTLNEGDSDYSPMALGSLTDGVTVREMAQAYSSIVNNGVFTQSRTYTMVYDSEWNVVLDNAPQTHVAWSENTAANLMNMLQNAVSAGTGTAAYFPSTAVGGKTGTTSGNMDRYFCGFTSYYVAAVWTGYDTPESMRFYGNPAVTIWKNIMQPIHEGLEYRSFPHPYIGAPTGIFGKLEEEEEEEPEVSETPTVSESPEVSPTPSATPTPEPPVTASMLPSVSWTPTPPPTAPPSETPSQTPEDTAPPVPTETLPPTPEPTVPVGEG